MCDIRGDIDDSKVTLPTQNSDKALMSSHFGQLVKFSAFLGRPRVCVRVRTPTSDMSHVTKQPTDCHVTTVNRWSTSTHVKWDYISLLQPITSYKRCIKKQKRTNKRGRTTSLWNKRVLFISDRFPPTWPRTNLCNMESQTDQTSPCRNPLEAAFLTNRAMPPRMSWEKVGWQLSTIVQFVYTLECCAQLVAIQLPSLLSVSFSSFFFYRILSLPS
jgi:hypothetical protein